MAMNLSGPTAGGMAAGGIGAALGSKVGAAAAPSAPAAQVPAQAPTAQPPAAQTPQQAPPAQTPAAQAPTTPAQTSAPTAQQPPSQQQQMAPDGRAPVTAQMPRNLSLPQGTTLFAQVASQDEKGGFMLQMGEHTVPAQTSQPLQVGQSIQLQVQNNQDGQAVMHLVDTPFTQMQNGELAHNLTELHLPVNESSMELAQAMVEHGLPLTGESFNSLQSQTAVPSTAPGTSPPPVDSRVSAVVFLTQNQIPVTGQNMLVLSNFLTANPSLGAQMFAVNGELKKLQNSLDNDSLAQLEELMAVLGGEGAEEVKTPGQPAQPATPPKLYNMAKQAGIENNWSNMYGSDDEKPDIAAYLRRCRDGLKEDGSLNELMSLLKGIEENLDAQKLINQAHPLQDIGFFYLQIPFSLFNRDGAQVWVRYDKRDDGRRDVDPDDARLEFLVTTEHFGNLFFVLELKRGAVTVEVSTDYEEVRDFLGQHLPALGSRIASLGWEVGSLKVAGGRAKSHDWVERTEFSSVQSCNVQA